jgi:hypothetical protein
MTTERWGLEAASTSWRLSRHEEEGFVETENGKKRINYG